MLVEDVKDISKGFLNLNLHLSIVCGEKRDSKIIRPHHLNRLLHELSVEQGSLRSWLQSA